MTTSQNGINTIKRFEKLELKAYKDSVGIWTIGYGTISYPDNKPVKEGHVVTPQRAEDLLKYEVKKKEISVVNALMNTKVTQNQFDALVSLCYNIGSEGLKNSTLIKKIRNNPNDDTTIKVDNIEDAALKDWLKEQGIKNEINTIHYFFMVWCKGTINGKRQLLKGLAVRRNKEYELYKTA